MLEADTPAPDFTLPNQDGEPVTLSSLRGKPVVLYFCPKADAPGYYHSSGRCRDGLGQRDRRHLLLGCGLSEMRKAPFEPGTSHV